MDLFVDEIFYGLQGEGNRMGFPSVFIRTGGCNLTCEGFGCELVAPGGELLKGCDTIHAVDAKFKPLWTRYENFNQLVEAALDEVPNELPYCEEKVDIVFTGGEPLLHHKNETLINAVTYFISRGHAVWFETNGTIDVDFDQFPIYRQCKMSMSVKMKESGELLSIRWKPDVVENYIQNASDSYFKFVIHPKDIYEGYHEFFDLLREVPSYAPVYLMPQGATNEELRANAKDVYEFATINGFRYSDRLHVRIYNDKRGV